MLSYNIFFFNFKLYHNGRSPSLSIHNWRFRSRKKNNTSKSYRIVTVNGFSFTWMHSCIQAYVDKSILSQQNIVLVSILWKPIQYIYEIHVEQKHYRGWKLLWKFLLQTTGLKIRNIDSELIATNICDILLIALFLLDSTFHIKRINLYQFSLDEKQYCIRTYHYSTPI